MSEWARRRVLKLTGLSVVSVLGGCHGAEKSARILDIRSIVVVEQEPKWILEVSVQARATAERYLGSSEAAFHDVAINGYSERGDFICGEDLGDIYITSGNTFIKTVRLNCDRLPYTIGPRASETPCDENTFIDIMVFKGFDEQGLPIWQLRLIDCHDKLPITAPNPG